MAKYNIHHPDLSGSKYGRWTVIDAAQSRFYKVRNTETERRYWNCICDCGASRPVVESALKSGRSVSCGCYNREQSSKNNCQHGLSRKIPEYAIWQAMRSRCFNLKNDRYDKYGGRGITICQQWDDFEVFIADMGRRPSDQHSLDREDNNKGYSPENCRWALPHTQMTNRSITRFVEVGGQQIPLATLAQQYGIPANTLRFRILKGWPIQEALTKPVRAKAKAT